MVEIIGILGDQMELRNGGRKVGCVVKTLRLEETQTRVEETRALAL
jgi:hypothetical protein